MADQQTNVPINSGSGLGSLKYPIQVLVGPLAFLIIQAIPFAGLSGKAHMALAAFAWVVAWWVAQPIPWAISGMLPLVLFPLSGVMGMKDAAGLYGQSVFFFLLGIMLFGHAFQKHGLGNRLAVNFLSIPGVATSGRRVVGVIMLVTAIVSAFIDDAASVAIVMPMALATVKYIGETQGKKASELVKFYTATGLGVLYASAAGGMVTPAGVPYNPLTISMLEELTKYSITFPQWVSVGIILGIVFTLVYWVIVTLINPPEVKSVTVGTAYFAEERKKLGPLSTAEKNVLVVLVIMVILWFAPAIIKAPKWLDIWIVPIIGMALLFLLPAGQGKKEGTLTTKDFSGGIMWNVLFLVLCGTAIAAGLAKVGLTDWIQKSLPSDLSPGLLPWMAGILTALISHLTSGTATAAMMSGILFPVAETLKYNPAILARIIAATALAVSFPWCGAGSGTAFSFGAFSFKDMFKNGVVITIANVLVAVILSMVLVPLFGGFTGP